MGQASAGGGSSDGSGGGSGDRSGDGSGVRWGTEFPLITAAAAATGPPQECSSADSGALFRLGVTLAGASVDWLPR